MFSGIVAGQGVVTRMVPSENGFRLRVRHAGLRVRMGDSVAVNGCCLTVVSNRNRHFEFDVLHETWKRTCFHCLKPLEQVNLELALRVGDRLGGHFVTGHIDGIGRIARRTRRDDDLWMEIEPPRGFLRWVVMKGSVAVDGVSLTVARVGRGGFGVCLIPHTLKLTTLGWKRETDRVNLEGDMLAKYAQNG